MRVPMHEDNVNIQSFHCDACGLDGCIEYKDHAGVYEVIQIIIREHHRMSPSCKGGINDIKTTEENKD